MANRLGCAPAGLRLTDAEGPPSIIVWLRNLLA